jgi:hypothetical protein
MEAKDDETRHSRTFIISSAGGNDKTYIFNTLIDAVRSKGGGGGKNTLLFEKQITREID